MPDELARLDATAQAEWVRAGRVSPGELVDAAIDRLERLNPLLNAVIHPALDAARTRARREDLPDGPFRGVPFLMKDIGGEEAGRPVHAGLGFVKRAGYRATQDSAYTSRIAAAGLVPLGRTNTSELAILPTTEPLAYGPTRNPWNTAFSAGGSSGGAAAAVAAGIVPAAHASDGGGSIRGPASVCGLIGLKPSRGRTSFAPGLGERWSGFSSEFAVTRTVRDAAALLDVVAGPAPGDPYFAPPPDRPFAEALREPPTPLRIGLMLEAPRDIPVHPELAEAVTRCGERLGGLGHHVEIAHPKALEEPATIVDFASVVACNVARAVESWGQKVGVTVGEDDVEPLTWALARRGAEISAPQLLAHLESVHGLGRRLAEWWDDGFDLLVTPTQALPPPRIGHLVSTREEPLRAYLLSAPYGVFTLPFNLSGQPAISLPGGFTRGDADWPAGLPLGVQLVAAYGNERLLLRVSAELEGLAPFTEPVPPHFG